MAMNNRKILIGGFAAGVVLNIIDYLSNGVIFADRMKADANALRPGLGDMMAQMTGGTIAGYVIMDFVIGGILVWAYAAMRPRFGPGAKTAIYVGLLFWIFGSIVAMGYMQVGLMSSGLWIQYSIVWLVALVLSAVVGGWVYTEDAATA